MKKLQRPISPGEIIQEQLTELNISTDRFAKGLGIELDTINSILSGSDIDSDIAFKLAIYFGTSTLFWVNIQSIYDARKKLIKTNEF